MKKLARSFALCLLLFGCNDATQAPPAQTAANGASQSAPYGYPPRYAQPPYAQPPYAQPPYAQPPYAQPPYAQPPYAPAPTPPQPQAPQPAPPYSPALARPLLGPLVGPAAWQLEARAVTQELVANLSPQQQARVSSIPLVFDPNPNEVNAFAGCDDNGAPYVAGTEGLLEAIDGIAQTRATDEIYGTQAYEAYVGIVAPRLVSKDGGSAMLPASVIPLQYWVDARRASRAHEIFDEIVAFTFGHEFSHHYLGHTGCANGQAGFGPALAQLGQLATSVLPLVNQPNEAAADVNGCINTLTTGRSRAPNAYRWTEQGGLSLLDFFARLDRASGANPWLGFLRTHPNPGLRIPIVQGTAATWRLQHPG